MPSSPPTMAPLSHLTLFLLLLSSPSLVTTAARAPADLQPFIRCFFHRLPAVLVIAGVLYTRDSPSFDAIFLSSINNMMFNSTSRRPLLIVTPTHESHVQASVACGREHGLRLRIRSGGHDFEGLSYRSEKHEPFFVVDLAHLRSVVVDTTTKTAWVGAGATVGELYYEISKKSDVLGFPAGIFPTVGVGGLVSGGGVGSMVRKYGLAADNVVDARLVDARGAMLDRSSMGEDLFWAIRGGGGASFGVVLSYKLVLVDVPPKVTMFTVKRALPIQQGGADLLVKWQQFAPKVDSDLYLAVRMVTTTVGEKRAIQASFQCTFLGEKGALLQLMGAGFPELGVEAEDCAEMSWIDSVVYTIAGLFTGGAEDLPSRRKILTKPFKSKYDFVMVPITESDWGEIRRWLLRQGEGEPWILELFPLGGRMDEIPEWATPYPHRKGNLFKVMYTVSWSDQGGDDEAKRHVKWLRRWHRFMAPYVSRDPRGAYFNCRDLDLGKNEVAGEASYRGAEIWGRRYFKSNFERLAAVKGKVDPANYFWSEQSIPPLPSPVVDRV